MVTESLREFTRFTWWMQNGARRPPTYGPRSTNLSPRSTNLSHRSACRQHVTTSTIAIHYYSARKLILILPSHQGRRLSRPRWLVTHPDGLPARKQSPVQVLTGPSVCLLYLILWKFLIACDFARRMLVCNVRKSDAFLGDSVDHTIPCSFNKNLTKCKFMDRITVTR